MKFENVSVFSSLIFPTQHCDTGEEKMK